MHTAQELVLIHDSLAGLTPLEQLTKLRGADMCEQDIYALDERAASDIRPNSAHVEQPRQAPYMCALCGIFDAIGKVDLYYHPAEALVMLGG